MTQKISTVDLYFFSGTGNTYLIVKAMKEQFRKEGISVNLLRLEVSDPSKVDLSHTIGLAFPVAEQGTYPFVWDFIRRLPETSGTGIFMMDTMLAFSGGIVGPVRKIVTAKGYNPLGAHEFRMPNNLFPKSIHKEYVKKRIDQSATQAKRYASQLIQGTSHWGRFPILSDIMGIFSQKEKTWQLLRNYYKLSIDPESCLQCGLCVKICPVSAITLGEKPVIDDRCILCLRCYAYCPKKAVNRSKKESVRYHAVGIGEMMKEEFR